MGVLHGADLDSESRNEGSEAAQAFLEISIRDEPGMFPGNKEKIAESKGVQVACLGLDLVRSESGAKNRIVP